MTKPFKPFQVLFWTRARRSGWNGDQTIHALLEDPGIGQDFLAHKVLVLDTSYEVRLDVEVIDYMTRKPDVTLDPEEWTR